MQTTPSTKLVEQFDSVVHQDAVEISVTKARLATVDASKRGASKISKLFHSPSGRVGFTGAQTDAAFGSITAAQNNPRQLSLSAQFRF